MSPLPSEHWLYPAVRLGRDAGVKVKAATAVMSGAKDSQSTVFQP